MANFFRLLCLFLVLGFPFTSFAQGLAASPTFYYEHLVIPFDPQIEADLKLTPQQCRQIERLRDPVRDTAGIQFAQDYMQRKKDVLRILNEDQRHRLKQLTFQYQGALASFLLPDVSASIGLLEEQREKLESFRILLEAGYENFGEYEKLLYGADQNRGRFFGELRHSYDVVAESILTPEQHLKWRGLQGPILSPRPKSWRY